MKHATVSLQYDFTIFPNMKLWEECSKFSSVLGISNIKYKNTHEDDTTQLKRTSYVRTGIQKSTIENYETLFYIRTTETSTVRTALQEWPGTHGY